MEKGIRNVGVPGNYVPHRHFLEQFHSVIQEVSPTIHVEGAAPDKHIIKEADSKCKPMGLFTGEGHPERSRGLEDTGEREVIGQDTIPEHLDELEQGESEVAIVNGARDEGGPGDDGTGGGVAEEEQGGVKAVKFRVHVDEVVGEEDRELGGGLQGLGDVGMGGSAQEMRAGR